MRCDTRHVKDQFRTFQPRSDLLFTKFSLPRLLVEVNSKLKPNDDMPLDLVRMLLTGTAIVRFANRFLDKFKTEKNFVFFAIYVWDDGKVTRYSLFQDQTALEVCLILYITKFVC